MVTNHLYGNALNFDEADSLTVNPSGAVRVPLDCSTVVLPPYREACSEQTPNHTACAGNMYFISSGETSDRVALRPSDQSCMSLSQVDLTLEDSDGYAMSSPNAAVKFTCNKDTEGYVVSTPSVVSQLPPMNSCRATPGYVNTRMNQYDELPTNHQPSTAEQSIPDMIIEDDDPKYEEIKGKQIDNCSSADVCKELGLPEDYSVPTFLGPAIPERNRPTSSAAASCLTTQQTDGDSFGEHDYAQPGEDDPIYAEISENK